MRFIKMDKGKISKIARIAFRLVKGVLSGTISLFLYILAPQLIFSTLQGMMPSVPGAPTLPDSSLFLYMGAMIFAFSVLGSLLSDTVLKGAFTVASTLTSIVSCSSPRVGE